MTAIPSLRSVATGKTLEEAAEQAIRNYCGWHIAPDIQQTITLDGNGQHKILLPTRHLISVESVKIDGEDISEYRFSANGWLNLTDRRIPSLERCLEVTMTHGFTEAPAVLVQVMNAMVSRARMSPAGNIVNQRAGTQSVTFATSGGAVVGFPMLDAEKELLAPYKLTWGP